jgi:hypothetical protein
MYKHLLLNQPSYLQIIKYVFLYRYGPHIRKVAVNIINKQMQAIGEGQNPAWGWEQGKQLIIVKT